MSRTHLYRATAPGKPIASLVLAALWCGAVLTAIVGTAPGLLRGAPLHGSAASVHDSVFFVVAITALLAAAIIVVSELVAGPARLRALRCTGAVLLLLAGGVGLLDTSRRVPRPGSPASSEPTAAGTVPGMGVQRILWTGLGVVGALTVLVGGVSALRRWDHPL